MAFKKRISLALIVAIFLLHSCQASLLQDTLAKEFKQENDEEMKVEIVNDEKNNDEKLKREKDTQSGDKNEDKGASEDNQEHEASIILETIFKPAECDDKTKSGKVAVMHYTGWIGDKKFDSTIDPLKRYMPFEFIIGAGSVIKGFEEGIKEMCKGEQRKITIPPELGYGTKGAGLIPG